ncbi:MAG: DUF1176 domain-containing protein [Methylococcaceae bacterium]|nr:DUF1176 domain-containing protein [Methylococcaceae bacterium]
MKHLIHPLAWILPLLPTPAAAQSHIFKDWVVACDNTGHCEAVGYQAEEAPPAVALWLGRDAGPGTTVHARLMAQPEGGGDVGPLTIRAGSTTANGIASDSELTAEQIGQLIPALRDAPAAEVTDGHAHWTLSLAGIKAALLYMDDQQGRVGTATALIKKGPKPDSAVPPAKPTPLVKVAKLPPQPAEGSALIAAVLKEVQERDCWTEMPDESDPFTQIAWLSADRVLVLRECMRGAYQGSSSAWIASAKPPHKPEPVQFPSEWGGSEDTISEAQFEDGILASYAKGRGLGDCGSAHNWAWTGAGFVLVEATEAPFCRELPAGGFPLRTWTATVVH